MGAAPVSCVSYAYEQWVLLPLLGVYAFYVIVVVLCWGGEVYPYYV